MKRKTLTTAIIAGLTGVAGMASVANAVNVNPDGLGQVLIYPYYTARGENDTLISVVNTSSEGKVAKVRFLEGLNSREVLDFNLYLSAFDVWTGAVTEDGEGAKLVVSDSSCTVPYIFGRGGGGPDSSGEQAFLDFSFTGQANDGASSDIERVRSGYFEIIEMGTLKFDTLTDVADNGVRTFINFEDLEGLAENEDPETSTTGSEWAATHVPVFDEDDNPVLDSDGNQIRRPRDCDQLVRAWTGGASSRLEHLSSYWLADETTDLDEPTGGLFGAASIINVNDGTLFSYNATALDNWTDNIAHTDPGRTTPTLVSGSSESSSVFLSGQAMADPQVWDSNLRAVNAVLMNDALLNEYQVDPGLEARTEWVLTMPTKRFHVDTRLEDVFFNRDPVTNRSGELVNASGEVIRDPGARVLVLSAPVEGSGDTDGEVLWTLFAPSDGIFTDRTVEGLDFTAAEVEAVWNQIQTEIVARTPFGTVFNGSACEPIDFIEYDREENTPTEQTGLEPPIVSPEPPGDRPSLTTFDLCWETNVVRFAGVDEEAPGEDFETEILGETRSTTLQLPGSFGAGWAKFSFGPEVVPGDPGNPDPRSNPLGFPEGVREQESASGAVYTGLPVLGFGVTTFTNGTLTVDGQRVLSNYGGTFEHRGTRNVERNVER